MNQSPSHATDALPRPSGWQLLLMRVTRILQWQTRHGFMWAGVAAVSVALALGSQANLRLGAEELLLNWLQERQDQRLTHNDTAIPATTPSVAERVTSVLSHELPEDQAKLAAWISRQNRVGADAVAPLVAEAFALSETTQIDATVILAVMAVESRFNPFAQSSVGAQGLMQVLTRVHTDKYEPYGGRMAAFDPITNLRVGVQVLQDCIKRAGSLEGGLRLYVGAVTTSGQFYIDKVYKVQGRMAGVIGGTPLFNESKATPKNPESEKPAAAQAS